MNNKFFDQLKVKKVIDNLFEGKQVIFGGMEIVLAFDDSKRDKYQLCMRAKNITTDEDVLLPYDELTFNTFINIISQNEAILFLRMKK